MRDAGRSKSDKRLAALLEFGSPVSSVRKKKGSMMLADLLGSPGASSSLGGGEMMITGKSLVDSEMTALMPIERHRSISDRCTQFRKPSSAFVSRMASRAGSPGTSFSVGPWSTAFATSLPRPPPVPIVIIGMSANSDAESKQCAKEAGMDYFIEKPFAMVDFLRVLDSIEKET
jgi:CheY-like chemotaxis protein